MAVFDSAVNRKPKPMISRLSTRISGATTNCGGSGFLDSGIS